MCLVGLWQFYHKGFSLFIMSSWKKMTEREVGVGLKEGKMKKQRGMSKEVRKNKNKNWIEKRNR